MVTVMDVADFFVYVFKGSKDPITNLRLNKFLFFAQGWSLSRLGKPLFDEDFQSWNYGPVVPSVYEAYRSRGSRPITRINDRDFASKFDSAQKALLVDVARYYGDFSTDKLIKLSDEEDSPWHRCTAEGRNQALGKDDIREHFSEKEPLPTFDCTRMPGITVYRSPHPDGHIILPEDEFDEWDGH